MSIYATQLWFDARWPYDDYGPPYAYEGSHVMPDESTPRRGSVEVGTIPNHVARPGAPPGLHDWLRLGVDDGSKGATVVLDRRQVTAIRDVLTAWLERDPDPNNG